MDDGRLSAAGSRGAWRRNDSGRGDRTGGGIAATGKALARVGEGGGRVHPGIHGGARQTRQVERSAGRNEGEEDVARPRLSRLGLQPKSQGDERRLDHARPPGAVARDGAGFAFARRTDKPLGSARAALAAKLPKKLFRRAAADFA